ncbi:uncharacterized protein LOC120710827 isoform X2 [Panicum virgatum]|uniref:uncharacterized protein LOC120710827 isoform X2 n=1 Tax=Panicum virgatum TaxID=38727 RepID=UPI0019D61C07|nr:uncharacterized protein LOC120710827 isoform X2 [Panicum virgatum]
MPMRVLLNFFGGKASCHPICDNKALLKELLSADQQIPGRAAVASAGLGCGLVGRRQGKEHALVISNHWRDVDWLIGWILAQRSGCLGSKLAVIKSSRFLPVSYLICIFLWHVIYNLYSHWLVPLIVKHMQKFICGKSKQHKQVYLGVETCLSSIKKLG